MQIQSLKALNSFFVYPFKSQKATQKLLTGSLMVFAAYLIPIVPLFLITGYVAKTARQVMEGEGELDLPEWDDWGAYFTDGFKVSVVSFVYSLPAVLIYSFGFMAYIASIFCVVAMSSGASDSPVLATLYLIGLFTLMISLCVGSLFLFLMMIFAPAAMMHSIKKRSIMAAFKIGEWWRILRRNLSGYLIAFVIVFGLGSLLLYLTYGLYMTVILWCVLPIVYSFVSFYLGLVLYPLFAQAYREGEEELQV